MTASVDGTARHKDGKEAEPAEVGSDNDFAVFSVSRLILALLGLFLVVVALFWVRSAEVIGPSNEIYLDEAHIHGAVSSVGVQMDGRIAELHVRLGQTIEAGELLATLENEANAARVTAAARRRDRLRAELERSQVADRLATKEAEAALDRARSASEAAAARLEAARAERDLETGQLERTETLAERGTLPQSDLDAAREAAVTARARVARRQADLEAQRAEVDDARLRIERAALRAAEREVLRARISEAEAELTQRRALLAHTEIRAKESGLVLALPSRVGASVRAGDDILDLWRTDRIWMRAWVAEDVVTRVAAGDRAEVQVDALGDLVLRGELERVLIAEDGKAQTLPGAPASPLLPEESRFSVLVRIDPAATDRNHLLPGMSGSVRIWAGTTEPSTETGNAPQEAPNGQAHDPSPD